ncbi:tyrosine-type recombinase/integrase [Kolteria novifilia]|uniref:tyrosine-type recombinase/integrase n=1 Tax=Kolteria novifilia TaxID=2527975 RepID=UPI003AF3A4D0
MPVIDMPAVLKGTNRAKVRAAARINAEVFDRLLAACPDDHWRLLIAFCWHCGMRASESRWVRGEDIDLAGHRIHIPVNKAKDADHHCILSPEMDAALRVHFPSGIPEGLLIGRYDMSVDPSRLADTFRGIAKKAGVKGASRYGLITLHDLRRSFGTRMAAKVPAQTLQRLMRHAELATTMAFYADVEQAAVDALWSNVTVDVTPAQRPKTQCESVDVNDSTSTG